MSGICNFRDLGGLPVAGGGAVVAGQLFRSGVLAYLTGEDQAVLARHGIRTIVDLRAVAEIEKEPTLWAEPVDIVSFVEDASLARTQAAMPWETLRDPADFRALMYSGYASMAQWLSQHLRAIFRLLADGETPLLFHCAAGKDRTGVCAAVILAAIGVERDAIIADYRRTDAFDLQDFSRRYRNAGMGIMLSPSMTPEIEDVMIRADPEYLLSALAHIDEKHGGMEAYLRDMLGVDDAMLAAVRDRLVVHAAP